ncbi:MAG: universal stress protein [Lapillicoccus sp.]
MTILVGLSPDERGIAPLHLRLLIARSSGQDVEVVTVLPTPWPPRPHLADAEYRTLLESLAQDAHDAAKEQVGDTVSAVYRIEDARSVSSGLLRVAQEGGVSSMVLGSSGAVAVSRVGLGGVAERVVHSCGMPVYLSPNGFRADTSSRVPRVTAGFGRSDADSDLLSTSTRLAAQVGAELRVACFAVRPMDAFSGSIEPAAEDLIVDEWMAQLAPQIQQALASSGAATPAEVVVGRGTTWEEALTDVAWLDGELLTVGSTVSVLESVLPGSHASKIVRHSPVPVALMPRTEH